MTLQSGRFPNFGGRDTLLIWGDKAEIARLRDALKDFAGTKLPSLSLHAVSWAKTVCGTRVDMSLNDGQSGEVTVDARGQIHWVASPEEFAEFAEKLESLTSPNCISGHQYSDQLGQRRIQIIASVGEYPANFSALPP
ncbi:MAG TPA: hypothetical protein VKV32_18990 [Stellaceae bacterium]|nr:hypothetical protein [Stellaceae bacterium]